ncbi:hypothetical protein ABLT15_37250, partial [Paraburkholderia tropica]
QFPADARMLVRILKREAVRGGRKHVGTVMKRIGIATLYSKLNTHCRQSKHKIWPFLLGGHDDQSGKPGLGSKAARTVSSWTLFRASRSSFMAATLFG